MTEILSYELDEILQRAFLDLVPEDDRDRVWRTFALLANGETVRDFEAKFQHRDGSCRWLSWNVSAPANGGLLHMAGRDVTAGREAEQKLKRSEQLLRDMGELAQVGGWEVDAATRQRGADRERARG